MSTLLWWGKIKRERKEEKQKESSNLEEEKIVRWAIDDKENHLLIEEMVPRKFQK